MKHLATAALVLALLSIPVDAQHCGGKERWAVKDGTDSSVQQVDLANISVKSVHDLLQLNEPQLPGDDTTRVLPGETNVYRITAHLVKWKHECCKATDDSDYHLVMTDDSLRYSDENNGVPVTGHSFVAEIPDPNCLSGRSGHFGTSSPFLLPGGDPGPLDIRKARLAIEQQTPGADLNGGWNDMGGMLVEIVGVGFFDRAHGQTGRAPNNIEIHPILSINFAPTTGPTPTPGPGPGPTPTPPGPSPSAVQWEYQMITANSASDLTTQANTLGAQGWEMVSVVLDPSRTDKYVGYLKRRK